MRTYLLPLALLLSLAANAQNPTRIQLVLWGEGFTGVTDIAHADDDRLFIVQRTGIISILQDSMQVLDTPFLDITSQVNSTGDEQGLLGMAFDPDYASNGFFYLNYITGPDPGESVISRWHVGVDANMADPASEQIIYTYPQPFTNHNGGDLDFGPDGMLYIPFGDGGDAGDPLNNAQDLSDPLGDIIRLDVSDTSVAYAIPIDNPYYAAGPDTLPEIWASGLRNPFRFGFDREEGDMWIGDVGQGSWEEIDYVEDHAAGGLNFGWRCYEGTAPFNTVDCMEMSEYEQPVAVHLNDGNFGEWCAIIGGRVYRGDDWPHLVGHYIYTDWCKGEFWSLLEGEDDTWINEPVLIDTVPGWSVIAEDRDGELYVGNTNDGRVLKIIDQCPMDPPMLTWDGDQLISSPAEGYVWYIDNMEITGATEQTYVPTENGVYTVLADFGNGCTLVSDTLALLTLTTADLHWTTVSLVPNPANEEVAIAWSNNAPVKELRVMDLQGREVMSQPVAVGARTILSTRQLVPGNYLLQFRSADGSLLTTERLMVAH